MNTPSITITINQDQAESIMASLDLATKQGGINTAAKLLPIAAIITEAAQASQRDESIQST
jgi:hypothetical protein